jgi:hypothetical protein
VVAGRRLHASLASALDIQLNTYQATSETLIVSRVKQCDMLRLILPNNTAQALHIVPFPSEAGEGDTARMDRVLREQIYNSWWNGYLLGYPVRFIDSYLRSFHTTLSAEAIQQEVERAKEAVRVYFEQHSHLQRGQIRLGGDEDLLSEGRGGGLMRYFASHV